MKKALITQTTLGKKEIIGGFSAISPQIVNIKTFLITKKFFSPCKSPAKCILSASAFRQRAEGQ